MKVILFICLAWSATIIIHGNLTNQYSIKKSLVSVLYDDGHGTGFVIASDSTGSYIVTNKHVCRHNSADKKTIGAGRVHPYIKIYWTNLTRRGSTAEFIKTSPNHDLCLLRVPDKNIPRAKISKNNPYIGQLVRSIGNPNSDTNVYTTGKVGSLSEDWYGESAVQFNGDIEPGASGSPVYDDKTEVVGVACGGNFKAGNDSIFVNGRYLREFLGEIYLKN